MNTGDAASLTGLRVQSAEYRYYCYCSTNLIMNYLRAINRPILCHSTLKYIQYSGGFVPCLERFLIPHLNSRLNWWSNNTNCLMKVGSCVAVSNSSNQSVLCTLNSVLSLCQLYASSKETKSNVPPLPSTLKYSASFLDKPAGSFPVKAFSCKAVSTGMRQTGSPRSSVLTVTEQPLP